VHKKLISSFKHSAFATILVLIQHSCTTTDFARVQQDNLTIGGVVLNEEQDRKPEFAARPAPTETALATNPVPPSSTPAPFERLRGRVVDAADRPVHGAIVDIDDPSWDDIDNSVYVTILEGAIACPVFLTRFTFNQTTGPDGCFEWLELMNTRYNVTISCEGFASRKLGMSTREGVQTVVLHRIRAKREY